MPRTARRDAPGAIHHVLLRGIERRAVFRDERDRDSLLARLGTVLPECDVTCFAWAFMPNHVHFVLRTGRVPLARAMARVATGHAGYFNRRHDRVGHLFQNRYKSLLVEGEEHLKLLVRYVHRNPLRAGLVPDLDRLGRHRWTGHAALVGSSRTPFHAVDETLALFGPAEEARARLLAWMEDGVGGSDPGGGPVAERAGSAPDPARSSPCVSRLAVGVRIPQLDELVARVASEFGVTSRELARGSRRREVSRARAVIAHLACQVAGLAPLEVASRLGIGESATARAARRGRRLLQDPSGGVPEVQWK